MSETPHGVPRRSVLAAIAALGLFISAALGFLVSGFLSSAFRRQRSSARIRIGELAGLPESFRRQVVSVTTTEAWTERTERIVLYARREGAQPVVVLARCSHMGCTVAWKQEHDEFHCPCHAGIFDHQGAAVSGPPRSPLQRLETQVDSGMVYAEIQEA